MRDILSFHFYHLHWSVMNIRCPMDLKVAKKGRKKPNLYIEEFRGFVYCLGNLFWNQNWWGTSQAFIWYHLHWSVMYIRCPMDLKVAKKGRKKPNRYIEEFRGFVYCLGKLFWSQNWWGTSQAFIWYPLHWSVMNLWCHIDPKVAKKESKRAKSVLRGF